MISWQWANAVLKLEELNINIDYADIFIGFHLTKMHSNQH